MKSTVVFAISRLLDTVLYFRRCEASNVLPGLNLETYKCAKTHYVVHVRMTADDTCLMHEEYKKRQQVLYITSLCTYYMNNVQRKIWLLIGLHTVVPNAFNMFFNYKGQSETQCQYILEWRLLSLFLSDINRSLT